MTNPSMGRSFTRHELMLGAGNLRFDRDLRVGWQITPSIGIVAKDVMMLALSLESMKEPLERSIREVMIPSFRRNFAVSGRPKWPPLAPFTLEVKGLLGVAGGGAKPLIRTGALRRAVGMVSIWDIGKTSATVRKLPEAVWYGAIHQEGYGGFGVYLSAARRKLGSGASEKSIRNLADKLFDTKLLKVEAAVKAGDVGARAQLKRGRGVPQRQFIMFQEEDIDDIQQVFYEWLVEQTVLKGRFAR